MNNAEKNGVESTTDTEVTETTQEAKLDEWTGHLQSLRLDIARYNGPVKSTDIETEKSTLNFQELNISPETKNELEAKMQLEASFKERQRKEYETKWKEYLLLDEPLSFTEVQGFMQLERPNKFPSNDELFAHLRDKPQEAIQDAETHRAEIESQGGNAGEIIENYERFKDFKDFEIKRTEDLKHWDKIKSFLENSNLKAEGIRVIVIDNEEYWKNFYGSNPSKSVVEPKTIILKKEVFEQEDISEENLSWIVHEIGHLSFYDFLDDKKGEYMAGVEERQKYTETAMESIAFQTQMDYLKSIGKTREQCLTFMKSYIDESFGLNGNLDSTEKERKQKELEQLIQYVNGVFKS